MASNLRSRWFHGGVGWICVALGIGITVARAAAPVASELPEPSGGSGAPVYVPAGVMILEADPQLDEPPIPLAPGLSSTVEGINFVEDGTNNGFLHIPPDPHGAVGPNHLVSIVNTSIEWHTKAGVQQNSQKLGRDAGGSIVGSFFQPLTPANGTFDPKVIYDQYNGRFLAVTLERTDTALGDPSNTSRILVAVSDDSDPNGTWHYHAINSKINIGGTDRWADYPGFAVDANAVYITANMFSFLGAGGVFGGARLWIINKTPFYTGGAAAVTVHDPSGAVGQSAATLQPAHMYGAAQAGVGTFLVRYQGFSDGTNEFLSIIRVDNPLGAISFNHQFVPAGNIDNTASGFPGVPQSGTGTTIDGGDRRALNAVWRNNTLWTTASLLPPAGADAGQVTAHWWKVNTTTLAALSISDQGNVSGNDIAASAHTFYPSITVDASGNMAMGFALSAPSIFPGAYYTGRLATDPAGTVQPTGTIAAGVAFYIRTFGGGSNRWGDYSGISIDPIGESTFCAFNEYAMTQGTPIGGESGRWATRWGCFAFSRSIVGWRSVRTHGISTPRSIALNTSAVGDGIGGPTVETRVGGIRAIEVDFDGPVTLANSAGISISGQTTLGGVTGPPVVPYFPNSVSIVSLQTLQMLFNPGVLPDNTCYTIDLPADIVTVPVSGDRNTKVRALYGDGTMSGDITLSDPLLILDRAGQSVASNPHLDVDLSDSINVNDVLDAKARVDSPAERVVCP